MPFFSKKYISLAILGLTVYPTGMIYATESITSPSALIRESRTIQSSLPTPMARAWMHSRIKLYSETLRHAQRSYSGDAKAYQKEVGQDAAKFLRAIRDRQYSYTISSQERGEVEDVILGYQRELISVVREYISQVRQSDTRESGSMHVDFVSEDIKVVFGLDPYTVTQTRDMTGLQIEGGISLRVSGSEIPGKDIRLSLRGTVLLMEQDLYITLQSYSLSSTERVDMIESARNILSDIQGKTYYQRLDEDIVNSLMDGQKTLESTEKILKKLETASLLTPVAKQGNDYILMLQRSTIRDISRLAQLSTVNDIRLSYLLIPADLRINGTTMTLSSMSPGLEVSGTLSRDVSGTALLSLTGQGRATYDPWRWRIARTAGYWALAVSTDEYNVDAKATKTSAEASIKSGEKIIATARIDETGINAWTYNMQAAWENLRYNWDDDSTSTESMTLRVWGSLRREFGNFVLTPPTLYEEMSRLQRQLENL